MNRTHISSLLGYNFLRLPTTIIVYVRNVYKKISKIKCKRSYSFE